jgi:cyanophycin synthetase
LTILVLAIERKTFMKLIRTRVLRGPNIWTRHTALELEIGCEGSESDIERIPGFDVRLAALCSEMPALRSIGYYGCLTIAHALETTLLSLQAQAGCPVTYSTTAATPESGVYFVVVEYSEEDVACLALEHTLVILRAAWEGCQPEDRLSTAERIVQLRELDEDLRLGPSTGAIVAAAVARGIPFRRLTSGSLVQLGWGYKQRRMQAAEVDATSAVAEAIAQDKDLTKKLLHAAGVPVPLGRPVANVIEAWEFAQKIGLPVVVKPQDGSQGRGVTVNITSFEQMEAAFHSAAERGVVMVEKFLAGADYRLLVVGHRLVAAARRDPPQVIGDGVHSVRELVEKVNADPRRGDGHATSLTKIRFDDIAQQRLALQGLSPGSIPESGRRVLLRNNANLSTGGTATDVTDDVHPEVAARAVDAATMIGLHVCGVDVVCETVQKPLEEQQGGVVEVNAAPGLRMHIQPSFGRGRDIGTPIIADIFAPAEDGRIPVVAVTGVNGKTTTTRLIAHILTQAGLCVGMTNTDGVYVGDRQIDSGDCSGPKSARNVLDHPHVQAAVLETARGGILREGLGFDRCSVGVVTNIGSGDHLGMNHLHTSEDIVRVKKTIIQSVASNGWGVLNAADPLVASMATECTGQVIYFAESIQQPVLATHRAKGKRVVYVESGQIVASEGHFEYRIPLLKVALTAGGLIAFQVQNTLAAVAACWGLNIEWSVIQQGLATFDSSTGNAPGRFNMMQIKGATVVADYGHNPDAMRALVVAFDAMPTPIGARRTVVISAAGDRRDQDIREQTQILGAAFDHVILYEDACQRGRQQGEVLSLLRQGLVGATRACHIEEVQGEMNAIDQGLKLLAKGDQCLILIDQVEESLAYLRSHL